MSVEPSEVVRTEDVTGLVGYSLAHEIVFMRVRLSDGECTLGFKSGDACQLIASLTRAVDLLETAMTLKKRKGGSGVN
jgi:hypothetical protein